MPRCDAAVGVSYLGSAPTAGHDVVFYLAAAGTLLGLIAAAVVRIRPDRAGNITTPRRGSKGSGRTSRSPLPASGRGPFRTGPLVTLADTEPGYGHGLVGRLRPAA